MISPPDKNGSPAQRVLPASSDGNTLLFNKVTPDPGSAGAQATVSTVGRRTASGWVLTDATAASYLTSPDNAVGSHTTTPVIASSAFDRLIVNSGAQLDPTLPARGADALHLFTVAIGSGAATGIDVPDGVPYQEAARYGELLGASASLDTVVFSAPRQYPLLPAAVGAPGLAGHDLFYRRQGTTLRLVSILPDGSLPTDAVVEPVDGDAFNPGGRMHRVSDDGQRVFFYTGYFNDAGVDDRTGRGLVSESQRTGEAGQLKQATFMGASPSGDLVYFWSNDPLTDGVSGPGVYRYKLLGGAHGELTRLTGDPGPDGLGMKTIRRDPLFLPSNDGSTLYFVATAALAAGATAGQPNAYVWRGGQLRFVRTLAGDGAVQRVSRDGRFAVFSTTAAIDGAENGGRKALYVYDADGGTFACVSCRADGTPNAGDALLYLSPGNSFAPATLPRNVTDDGHVFFVSTDRLTGADTSAAPDVYVYENGAPQLLSAGDSSTNYLLDNSDDGATAFISTPNRLVARDVDDDFDIYAVRAGGGFLTQALTRPCTGESCQGPPSLLPAFAGAATVTFAGRGNPPAPGPAPKVTVSKVKAVTGSSGTLRVKVPGKGRLSVAGTGVIKATKSVSKAQTVSLKVVLTAASRKALRRKRSLTLHPRIVLTPSEGSPVTVTVSLRFTLPAKKGATR
jgi:catechol 2,3-dioxygenase-like lactoylglutathione lyase family enzyme